MTEAFPLDGDESAGERSGSSRCSRSRNCLRPEDGPRTSAGGGRSRSSPRSRRRRPGSGPQIGLGLERASALDPLAVAVIAIRQGTTAAPPTALGAFVIDNLLFVEPRFTLAVARPEELITLFLLLFVGVIIGASGGCPARPRAPRRAAGARAPGAVRHFARAATAPRLAGAIGTVLDRVRADAGMSRAWVGVGSTVAGERPLGDTGGASMEPVGTYSVLKRDCPEDSASWVRIHTGSGGRSGGSSAMARYRVALVADRVEIGSLWSERPSRSVNRLSRRTGSWRRRGPGGPGASSRPARRRRG